MTLLSNKPAVIFTAVVFLLFAAAILFLGFAARAPGSDERLADCLAAGVFLFAAALLLRRRRWVQVCCSLLLAVIVGNFAFVVFEPMPPSPAYSIPILRAIAVVATGLLAWLFMAFAFGRAAREHFTKPEPPKDIISPGPACVD